MDQSLKKEPRGIKRNIERGIGSHSEGLYFLRNPEQRTKQLTLTVRKTRKEEK
jgi:hypothetical protein